MNKRVSVPDTDVTYEPVQQASPPPSEILAFLDGATNISLTWASGIRRGDSTYAGMYCGPPANLVLVDPRQAPGNETLSRDLAMATLIHEVGHARLTPASQEEEQKKYARLLRSQDAMLFDGLLDALEDERIERRIAELWPGLVVYLKCRWTHLIETLGRPAVHQGELDKYGRAQVLAVARLDYLHKMLDEDNWFTRPEWQRMAPGLKRLLAIIRGIKKQELRSGEPEAVPALAFEFVKAARQVAASEP